MILKPEKFSYPIKGHPLSKSLAGCWLFNDSPPLLGKTFDVSGNRNTGTLVSNTAVTSGKFGPALNFDGSSDFVTFDSEVGKISSVGKFTIACWFNARSVSGNQGLVGGYVANSPQLTLQGDKLSFLRVGFQWMVTGVTSLLVGAWYHGALTYDGSNGVIYLNGIIDKQNAFVYSFASSNTRFGDYTVDFDGVMDSVQIWNRALSASEIALLYREPFCMFEREPIELWTAATSISAPPIEYENPMMFGCNF